MSAEIPAKKSNASRYLFLFLVGLVIGAIATVLIVRALQARQDPFPHAVMHVMGKHAEQLQQTIQRSQCAATDTVPHVRTLRAMANDLETAFPGLADDQRFTTHASQFRAKLDEALTAPPTDCAAAGKLGEQIGKSCKGCHQDFRG
ncbi:MAG: cytochrome c [Pseudoxanthomonas sp.]